MFHHDSTKLPCYSWIDIQFPLFFAPSNSIPWFPFILHPNHYKTHTCVSNSMMNRWQAPSNPGKTKILYIYFLFLRAYKNTCLTRYWMTVQHLMFLIDLKFDFHPNSFNFGIRGIGILQLEMAEEVRLLCNQWTLNENKCAF